MVPPPSPAPAIPRPFAAAGYSPVPELIIEFRDRNSGAAQHDDGGGGEAGEGVAGVERSEGQQGGDAQEEEEGEGDRVRAREDGGKGSQGTACAGEGEVRVRRWADAAPSPAAQARV